MAAIASGARPTLRGKVSVLHPASQPATSLELEYNKRLMVVSGRANPELAHRIAGKLGVDLSAVTLKTFSNGEVYCRFDESMRGGDVFIVQPTCGNPRDGRQRERLADGAAADDRRGGRRLRPPRDRRHAVVRLLAAGQEVDGPGADLRPPRRARAGGRGGGPGADHGPARGADPGLLPEARGSHDGDVHAHAVLPRHAAGGRRGRLARRRPREAGEEVRREGGRRAGDPQQGAPGPAGRRDRLRDRRREGPHGDHRRRHDRHGGHAARRRRDGDERGRPPRVRHRHAPGAVRQRLREPGRRRRSSRSSSRTRSRCARACRTTSRCSRSPTC